jgi:hypothetical protein
VAVVDQWSRLAPGSTVSIVRRNGACAAWLMNYADRHEGEQSIDSRTETTVDLMVGFWAGKNKKRAERPVFIGILAEAVRFELTGPVKGRRFSRPFR